MLLFTAAISLQNKASTTTNQLSCPKGLGDTSLRTPLEINLSLILAQLRRHLCTVCLVAIELLLKPSSWCSLLCLPVLPSASSLSFPLRLEQVVLLDSDENDSVSCCVVFNFFIVFHSYGRYIRKRVGTYVHMHVYNWKRVIFNLMDMPHRSRLLWWHFSDRATLFQCGTQQDPHPVDIF